MVPSSPAIRMTSISDLYELHTNNMLGTGAFSTVVLATCKKTNEPRAIKVIAKTKLEGRKAMVVAHEKEILRRVSQQNIIKLFECIETDAHFYMVLEKMDTDLYEWIRQNRKLCEQDASKVTRALLKATKYLHDHSIVHRDIKPENILINNVDSVKLADFGLAKILSKDMVSATPCGTSFYIAPEIIRGIQMNGVRPVLTTSHDIKFLDMWSIGVVLYIMLAGTPPFTGQIRSRRDREELLRNMDRGVLFPDARWNNISENAKNLIEGLLSIDTAKRLTSEQALQHPFIKNWEQQPQEALPTPAIFEQIGDRAGIIKAMVCLCFSGEGGSLLT